MELRQQLKDTRQPLVLKWYFNVIQALYYVDGKGSVPSLLLRRRQAFYSEREFDRKWVTLEEVVSLSPWGRQSSASLLNPTLSGWQEEPVTKGYFSTFDNNPGAGHKLPLFFFFLPSFLPVEFVWHGYSLCSLSLEVGPFCFRRAVPTQTDTRSRGWHDEGAWLEVTQPPNVPSSCSSFLLLWHQRICLCVHEMSAWVETFENPQRQVDLENGVCYWRWDLEHALFCSTLFLFRLLRMSSKTKEEDKKKKGKDLALIKAHLCIALCMKNCQHRGIIRKGHALSIWASSFSFHSTRFCDVSPSFSHGGCRLLWGAAVSLPPARTDTQPFSFLIVLSWWLDNQPACFNYWQLEQEMTLNESFPEKEEEGPKDV